jgi:hypothetical protein
MERVFAMTTSRTLVATGPAKIKQVLATGFLCGKFLLKLYQLMARCCIAKAPFD